MKRYILFYFAVIFNFVRDLYFKSRLNKIKDKNSEEYQKEIRSYLNTGDEEYMELEIQWILAIKEISSWFHLNLKEIKTTVAFRKVMNRILPTETEEEDYMKMLYAKNTRLAILNHMIAVGDVEQRRVDFYLEMNPEKKLWLEGNKDGY